MSVACLRRWVFCLPALLLFWACCPQAVPGEESPPAALETMLLSAWSAGADSLLLAHPMPLDAVETTYYALLDSAPELFWAADGFAYTAVGQGVVELRPTYLCAQERLQAMRHELAAAIDRLSAVLPPHGSDYARAYALHDALAVVTDYGKDADSPLGEAGAYTAYGALVDGVAVCRGYAMAYLALLGRAGITAEYVRSDDMAHGWVRARLDGCWYHIDVTWDDRSPISHRRFARTDRAMHALGYVGWQ